MKYLIQIKDNEIIGYSNLPVIDDGITNCEVEQELYDDYVANPDKYIAGEKEIEIDVPEFDDEGNPIMVEVEETITVIDYANEGNPIGEHEETITKQVQKTHKEKVTVPYPVINPNYEQEQLAKLKSLKSLENAQKAKLAVENGYVEFKNAQFETNAQTVGDLTATMLLMSQTGAQTYDWLSRDDKVVELSLEDFGTLGSLIANYKNAVWNVKYLAFKNAINKAKTLKAIEKIVIDYDNIGDLS